jgi:hypothetical protein
MHLFREYFVKIFIPRRPLAKQVWRVGTVVSGG